MVTHSVRDSRRPHLHPCDRKDDIGIIQHCPFFGYRLKSIPCTSLNHILLVCGGKGYFTIFKKNLLLPDEYPYFRWPALTGIFTKFNENAPTFVKRVYNKCPFAT